MFNSVWVKWPLLLQFGTIGSLLGMLILGIERGELQDNNLFDLDDYDRHNANIVCDERSLTARTEDGTCNILDNPAEGSVYRRFGRNVGLDSVQAEVDAGTLLSPNPRDVSNSLMARGNDFKPATTLNFLAVAWIQFMVHDWVDHEKGDNTDPIVVPLPANDPLGSGSLSINRTKFDSSREADEAHLPPSYRNTVTHWWDGSQIYGSSKAKNDEIRSFVDGKLTVTSDGTLPTNYFSGIPVTGFTDNWWLGLSMMHQLFTLEHNAIADMLNQQYPGMDDQWVYDKARLINSALMAKIHTVEWTPAVIANPVGEGVMYANWWGILDDGPLRDVYRDIVYDVYDDLEGAEAIIEMATGLDLDLTGELGANALSHIIGGLVGSTEPVNSGTAYTLTEEFVAVYRMHPLLRDNVEVYDIGTNVPDDIIPLEDTRDGNAEDILDDEGADRLWYSFGVTNPGSLTLHNYPEFLRDISIPLRGDIDVATTDIVRDRERGIPRYNEFRRQIGLTPINEFEDLTDDPHTLAELKRLYDNDVEKIDALVGQLAETVRPEGYAFGETTFQIFILNASRRLMTDRFYTTDFRADVYTQEGLEWVNDTTMVDVLRRHFPSLNTSLVGMDNAFKPWGINIPDNYDSLAACDKQQILWENGALRTEYAAGERPDLVPVDILGLVDSVLWKKVQDVTDVAPPGYEKPIHPYGAMAKVSYISEPNHDFTGVFQGNECGLLRLSVTGDPSDRGFAPGLAWKTLIDGKNSENVSALYTLSGQGNNHDFFANELSQYVPAEVNETIATTALFSLVSSKPTTLSLEGMAEVNENGTFANDTHEPKQIYFVPTNEVKNLFSENPHDFRDDLVTLPVGTKIYDVYATDKRIRTSVFGWLNRRWAEDRRNDAEKIGSIYLTSEFITSQFGDTGIFFKHQRIEDG